MKTFRIACAGWMALITLVVTSHGAAAAPALFVPTSGNLQAERQQASADGRRLLVLFSLADCGPCERLEKAIERSPELKRRLRASYKTVRLNLAGDPAVTDTLGARTSAVKLAASVHAAGTPTLLFFDNDGRLQFRYSGPLSADEFLALLAYVQRGDYTQPFLKEGRPAPRQRSP